VFYNLGVRRTRIAEQTDNGAFLSVSMPLGIRSSASFRADENRAIAMVALAPPTDLGAGYQLAAGYDARTGEPVISASSLIRSSIADIELAGDRNSGGEGIRVSARGTLTAVAGNIVATPRVENAFALVELDSTEDVTLFLENRPVVVRGGRGRTAVLGGLQPYADNRIGIDVESLPITADVAVAEKLVVPGFRQAVRVGFGGAERNALTIMLVDQDGVPLPAGLAVRAGERIASSTGYDGMVFLPELAGAERLAVNGPGVSCEAWIPAAPAISESRLIGPVACLPYVDREDLH
jgi:outer membrane usher protein